MRTAPQTVGVSEELTSLGVEGLSPLNNDFVPEDPNTLENNITFDGFPNNIIEHEDDKHLVVGSSEQSEEIINTSGSVKQQEQKVLNTGMTAPSSGKENTCNEFKLNKEDIVEADVGGGPSVGCEDSQCVGNNRGWCGLHKKFARKSLKITKKWGKVKSGWGWLYKRKTTYACGGDLVVVPLTTPVCSNNERERKGHTDREKKEIYNLDLKNDSLGQVTGGEISTRGLASKRESLERESLEKD